MRCSLFVAGYYLSVRLFVLVKGPVNKYRGGGGWAGAERGWVTSFSAFPMGWVRLF